MVVVDRRGTRAKDLTTTAPAFIVEVLSLSTSAIDRRDKAAEYMRLSSVAAYLILSQDEIKAWVYAKSSADCLRPDVVDRAGASISVTALGIDLPLSEIYADVELN